MTMVKAAITYDVFLSHSLADRELADELSSALEGVGLRAFKDESITAGGDIRTQIWDALAESRALVAIVPETKGPDAMGFVEIGAATAWNKPVYVVLSGSGSGELPDALRGYRLYTRNRINDVVLSIRSEFDPLSDEERDILLDVYRKVGVPADRLSQSFKSQRDLSAQFEKHAGRKLPAERLLSEIFRLRKHGSLPRLKR